jgi:hypothetical protein
MEKEPKNLMDELDIMSEIVAYEIRQNAKSSQKPIIKLNIYDGTKKSFEKKFKVKL